MPSGQRPENIPAGCTSCMEDNTLPSGETSSTPAAPGSSARTVSPCRPSTANGSPERPATIASTRFESKLISSMIVITTVIGKGASQTGSYFGQPGQRHADPGHPVGCFIADFIGGLLHQEQAKQ